MLEGLQQSYPGVATYPQVTPQTGFNPIGSGIQGLFGQGGQAPFGGQGMGRQLDPVTIAYLQQQQMQQMQQHQQPYGSPFGRLPLDPITAAYIQQAQLAQLTQQQNVSPFGGGGQFGRPMTNGLDLATLIHLQQHAQLAQQAQLLPQLAYLSQLGRNPFQNPFQSQFPNSPFQNPIGGQIGGQMGHVGAGAYGPLSPWI